MNSDRIKRAQKAISTMLPPRQEYVVDTSEFEEVKAHLAKTIDDHHSVDNGRPVLKRRGPETKDGNGPVLRRKTSAGTSN
jgi:hypothetical protein